MKKLTTRSTLAILICSVFSGVVFLVSFTVIPENYNTGIILGALISNVTTIIIFYFRKAQSKESETEKPTNIQTHS
jgi:hypothetical protein